MQTDCSNLNSLLFVFRVNNAGYVFYINFVLGNACDPEVKENAMEEFLNLVKDCKNSLLTESGRREVLEDVEELFLNK